MLTVPTRVVPVWAPVTDVGDAWSDESQVLALPRRSKKLAYTDLLAY